MNKKDKIKIIIFTSIILISSIILVYMAANAYSYPDANQTGKVSITMDDNNRKVIINNPNNLSLSYLVEKNTGLDDSQVEQLKNDQNSINTLQSEINTLTNEINSLESQLSQVTSQKNIALSQLESIDNNINNVHKQIDEIEENIERTTYQLNDISLTLEDRKQYGICSFTSTNGVTFSEEGALSFYTNEYNSCLDRAANNHTFGSAPAACTINYQCGWKEDSKITKSFCDCHHNAVMAVFDAKRYEYQQVLQNYEQQLDTASSNLNSLNNSYDTVYANVQSYESQINDIQSLLTSKENTLEEKQTRISTIQRQMPSISLPSGSYTNLSSNEIKYEDIIKTAANALLWIKSTSGSNTYYDYFLVQVTDVNTPDIVPPTYKVTFDPVGGTIQTQSKDVMYGEKYGTLPTATKEGYTFIGWFTAKENGTQIKSDTIVNLTANQTLYAHYTQNNNATNEDNNSNDNSDNNTTNENSNNDNNSNNDDKTDNKSVKYQINEITSAEKDKIVNSLLKDAESAYIVNIDVENNENQTIIVKIPNGMNKNDNIKVYEIKDNKRIDVRYKIDSNGNIVFETNHDGIFAIVVEKPVKYEIKDITSTELENIKKEFSDFDSVYAFESTVNDEDKGKEIKYSIDLPTGFTADDNIQVYAYVDGEKIIIPSKIENGKLTFTTTLTGKFVIAKAKKVTNTVNTNNTETIINPQTGDINVKIIVILLVLAIIVSGISLIYIIKNNKKN